MQVTHVNSTLSLTWNKIDDYLLPNIWVNQSFGLGLSGIDQAPYSLPHVHMRMVDSVYVTKQNMSHLQPVELIPQSH